MTSLLTLETDDLGSPIRAEPERPTPADPAQASRAGRHAAAARVASPVDRAGWSVVALLVAFAGERAWTASVDVPGANWAAVALILVGLTGVALALGQRRSTPRWAQLLLLTALAVGISYQALQNFLFDPAYGTDAAAFDQYAAMLVQHGHNPYAQSMAPSLSMFHVPAIFHTFRLDGSAVTDLSYPAGSFLPYVPLLLLGVTTQVANIVDLAFWFAGMFLLWRCLPRDMRWLAGVLGAATLYVGFVIGGLTDALFVPFVIVAVYRWDRFIDHDRSAWKRWVGPIALGAAISVKQTPWFLVPFLLLGLCFECRARGLRPVPVLLKYVGAAGSVFAIVNLPFVLTAPRAWLHGALVPFVDPTIPDGQGLVNLTIFHGIGGGDLRWFSLLGAAFVLSALVLFTARYDLLKRCWVPLIAVAFFLPTRSFGSYLFMMFPAALVAATTVRAKAVPPFEALRRKAGALLAIAVLLVGSAAAAALTARSPLQLAIVGTRSTGELQTLDQVRVRVTNRTGQVVRPHFSINSSDHATTFWYVLGERGADNIVIAAHSTRTITLQAPNTASMPGVSAPLFVEAFTATPPSISVSPSYLVSGIGTRIVPDSVDLPVRVGRPVSLRVQAENQYGTAIRRAGIPIILSEIVYGQSGFYAGEASINGNPEGHTPVTVATDATGTATFTVVGQQAQDASVYFQAWIADGTVPHGYSNQVSIRFIAAR